jgi:hypothetical protein
MYSTGRRFRSVCNGGIVGGWWRILRLSNNVMSSHINSQVNDAFEKWLQTKYGQYKNCEVKAHRGKKHDFLGMVCYVKNMLDKFPVELKSTQTAITPASEGLLNLGQGKKLSKEDTEAFKDI